MVLTPNPDAQFKTTAAVISGRACAKVRARDSLKSHHFILRTPRAAGRARWHLGCRKFASLLGWIAAEGWCSKYSIEFVLVSSTASSGPHGSVAGFRTTGFMRWFSSLSANRRPVSGRRARLPPPAACTVRSENSCGSYPSLPLQPTETDNPSWLRTSGPLFIAFLLAFRSFCSTSIGNIPVAGRL